MNLNLELRQCTVHPRRSTSHERIFRSTCQFCFELGPHESAKQCLKAVENALGGIDKEYNRLANIRRKAA